ncbi:unnamed protein product [Owenia fusiformis]|uniref:P-type domain-containing protein n=1 Tax=Owenia fusiformis TaxID=6347 RepID=A0A8S4N552_OWEFU|nr:unnamed protein product [Owenia fusiformis]
MFGLSLIILAGLCNVLVNANNVKRQSSCPVNVADSERRDCFKWVNASPSKCEERGCVWCEASSTNYPFCFYNDKTCPSSIADNAKVDCHPEPNGNKASCNAKGCVWCESATQGVPWCFIDQEVSQGGARCPVDIKESERIDCHPDAGANEANCIARGCYWCQSSTPNVPWCFAPKSLGYTMNGAPISTAKGYRVNLKRRQYPSWFGLEIDDVNLDVEFQTESRLRLKFTDATASRFEVPSNIPSPPSAAPNTLYDVQFNDTPAFNVKVTRKSTGVTIFDSSIGGLKLSDQFMSIGTYLPCQSLYGFGEHEHPSFKHDMNWKTYGMYARDQAPAGSNNLYGVHPFYTCVESDYNANAVLFLNANAQDVTLMPDPALYYKTIGGILDIYIFLGPTLENTVQQYTEAVGRPVMPPYWSLGFQLSRWGYNSIANMQTVINRMRQYNIPHDVQYGDIDYMDRRLDFTYDRVNYAGLPQYVTQLKQEGTKFIIILDPGISTGEPAGTYQPYELGNTMGVWIKDTDNTTDILGEVWPDDPVVFPDFTKQVTEDWWIQLCVDFKNVIDYDGLWIDMNEVANFQHGSFNGCPDSPMNNPPYLPRVSDNLYQKTLCPSHNSYLGSQYNVHSLYGWSQVPPTHKAAITATGQRSLVLTRSSFPGAGSQAVHWLGDNHSLWTNLHYSIIGMMEFNLFGFPYVGADICGFNGDTTASMCQRWMQLGAFYTFSRNHNARDRMDQDPGYFGAEVARVSRESLEIRYTLLPYLYTLFHRANLLGSTVIRPLVHEYTSDSNTHNIDRQFLWGPAFMITPVLDEGATSVTAYFPDSRWYDYYTGAEVSSEHRKGYTTLNAPMDYIPLHIRGGYILPTQEPANSTTFSRNNDLGLIVALDDFEEATGDFFWDDGDAIDTYSNLEYIEVSYSAIPGILTGVVVFNGYPSAGLLVYNNTIRILGLNYVDILDVRVNNQPHSLFSFNPTTKVLEISMANLFLNDDFQITWTPI